MESKFCKFCQCEHPLTEDWWYIGSPIRCKARKRDYQNRTKERKKLYDARHYEQNKDKKQEYRKQNRDTIKRQRQAHYIKNREVLLQYRQEYYEQNRESILKHGRSNRHRYHGKYKTDFKVRLSNLLRSRLRTALNGMYKSGSAVRDLGCSITELKQHLESKFQSGMTWENHGIHGWHIDHIIPLSSFDLSDVEQLNKACHYTNLQPLWAEENLKKSDKVA